MNDHFDLKSFFQFPVVVGLIGALFGLRFSVAPTREGKVLQVASGVAAAYYLSPALVTWFGLEGDRMASAINFLTGAYGVVVATSVHSWWQSLKLSDLLPYIKRKDPEQ